MLNVYTNEMPPFVHPENQPDSIASSVELLRKNFNLAPLDYTGRIKQLQGIKQFIKDSEDDIKRALYLDLKKPAQEAYLTEIAMIKVELKHTLKNLKSWMKSKRVPTLMAVLPGKSYIRPEPLGLILILSAWNYPLALSLVPLIGALAAGNNVVLKPSEMAPETSALLAKRLPQYLDMRSVAIIEGGVNEATLLLDEQFDYILYTGNSEIAKKVMTAAAKHLTPVTLELGGKSPCIVDADADIDQAAERILWGKFCNAGQTCIAPDYVLAHESIEDILIQKMTLKLNQFYGETAKNNPNYGGIINSKHYHRLMNLMTSGDIIVGGEGDESLRYIAPTLLRNVSPDAPIMDEKNEIFGPLLPILKIKHIDEAITFINKRPKPLALYLFSKNPDTQEHVIQKTSSGSATINHTLMQNGIPSLPFGGVGASGMGAYHGKKSFDTFSHYKSIFIKPAFKFDLSALLYPPYNKLKEKLLRLVL